MDAIRKVHRYIERHPRAPESLTLAALAASLAQERVFPLGDLYDLELEAFDLAMELMRDWRLDRYYAGRLAMFEPVLAGVWPARRSPVPAETPALLEPAA